jgi:electron transport complex protein RnfG
MKTSVKMVVVLTVISMVAGGFLAAWDRYTLPKIEAFQLEELKKAITEVLPAYDAYNEIRKDGLTIYEARRNDTPDPVGLAFEAAGNGFQGRISIMVGVTPDFSEITGIKILEQIETPGLGTKIVSDPGDKMDPFWFPNQFKQLKTEPQITYIKNLKPSKPNEIQAITGATISSKSVVNILNDTISRMKKMYLTSTTADLPTGMR